MPTCILCGSSPKKHRQINDATGSFTYCECSNKKCGLFYQYPFPSNSALQQIYSREYYKNWGGYYANREQIRTQKKLTYAQAFEKKDLLPGSKVLDCGCATGALLQWGTEHGWDVYGVDINPVAIEESKQIVADDHLHLGTLNTVPFTQSFFDALCMFDYIEHPADPREVITQAAFLLKQNGILYVTTPDTSHWLMHVLNRYWPHFLREHLHLFSERSITMLLVPDFNITYCGSFKKVLTFAYVFDWIIHHNLFFAPLARFVRSVFPPSLLFKKIKITTSEILVIAKRK